MAHLSTKNTLSKCYYFNQIIMFGWSDPIVMWYDLRKGQGLTLLDEMQGHPSITRLRDEGFTVVAF